jgi:hypothetical protein
MDTGGNEIAASACGFLAMTREKILLNPLLPKGGDFPPPLAWKPDDAIII